MLTEMLVRFADPVLTAGSGIVSRRILRFRLKRQAMDTVHRKDFHRRQYLRFKTHIMAAVRMMPVPGNKEVLAPPTIRASISHDLDLSKIRGRLSNQP
jgi:hypothetical protein